MTPMSPSYRRDLRRMARCREPVVNRGADAPALHRGLPRAVVTGDQQHDALAASNRLLESPVDRRPSAVQVHAVKVEHSIRCNVATSQPLVPGTVEGSFVDWNGFRPSLRRSLRRHHTRLWYSI